jgi:hypothetical protein
MSDGRRTRCTTATALLAAALSLAPLQAATTGTGPRERPVGSTAEVLQSAWILVQALWSGTVNPPSGGLSKRSPGTTPSVTNSDPPPEGSGLDPHGNPKP